MRQSCRCVRRRTCRAAEGRALQLPVRGWPRSTSSSLRRRTARPCSSRRPPVSAARLLTDFPRAPVRAGLPIACAGEAGRSRRRRQRAVARGPAERALSPVRLRRHHPRPRPGDRHSRARQGDAPRRHSGWRAGYRLAGRAEPSGRFRPPVPGRRARAAFRARRSERVSWWMTPRSKAQSTPPDRSAWRSLGPASSTPYGATRQTDACPDWHCTSSSRRFATSPNFTARKTGQRRIAAAGEWFSVPAVNSRLREAAGIGVLDRSANRARGARGWGGVTARWAARRFDPPRLWRRSG